MLPLPLLYCPRFESIVSKDELAGLACLEDVESRIVWGAVRSAGIAEDGGGSDEWEVEHGPFDEGTFTEVMDWRSHWTLLVNEVNRHIPEVIHGWYHVYTHPPGLVGGYMYRVLRSVLAFVERLVAYFYLKLSLYQPSSIK